MHLWLAQWSMQCLRKTKVEFYSKMMGIYDPCRSFSIHGTRRFSIVEKGYLEYLNILSLHQEKTLVLLRTVHLMVLQWRHSETPFGTFIFWSVALHNVCLNLSLVWEQNESSLARICRPDIMVYAEHLWVLRFIQSAIKLLTDDLDAWIYQTFKRDENNELFSHCVT